MFDFFEIDSTSIGIILIVIILWIHVLKNKFGIDIKNMREHMHRLEKKIDEINKKLDK
jgi:hypothetical protein